LLEAEKGAITVETVMHVLRDHGPSAGYGQLPRMNGTVCWHAGYLPVLTCQTTGSMVSHLLPDVQTHYVTGTSAPCTSIFKPVWLGAELPEAGQTPNGTYEEAALFWRHESLHRAALNNYATNIALYREERDAMEHRFVAGVEALRGKPLTERAAYTERCHAEADAAEKCWMERIQSTHNPPSRHGLLYKRTWRNFDRRAGMLR
jgi:dipeptidase